MKTVKMYSISDLKRSTVQIKLKMTNESKGPRTKMLLVYVGATDSSNQPKIKYCLHMVLSMFAVLFSHGFVHVFSVRIVLAILTSLIATTT